MAKPKLHYNYGWLSCQIWEQIKFKMTDNRNSWFCNYDNWIYYVSNIASMPWYNVWFLFVEQILSVCLSVSQLLNSAATKISLDQLTTIAAFLMYDYHVYMVQNSNARLHSILTVIVGERATFSLQFQGKNAKMCILCTLIHIHILQSTLVTDEWLPKKGILPVKTFLIITINNLLVTIT